MQNKVSSGTIARTICLGLALLNQVLIIIGKSPLPIEDETISLFISTIATIAISLISWWKNNSFSQKAIEADKVLHKEKDIPES